MNNKRSTIHTRLRHESLALIVASFTFSDGESAKIRDFESSASRFNAFSKRIGYQPATEDAAAFYSALKAEVLFADYDGTMNVDKIFRGPLLLIVRSFTVSLSSADELPDLCMHHPWSQWTQRLVRWQFQTPGSQSSTADSSHQTHDPSCDRELWDLGEVYL